MKLNDLTGKTAIVTGAAQGLSCGMAEGLMEAGAKVCIMDINPKAEVIWIKKRISILLKLGSSVLRWK